MRGNRLNDAIKEFLEVGTATHNELRGRFSSYRDEILDKHLVALERDGDIRRHDTSVGTWYELSPRPLPPALPQKDLDEDLGVA